MYKQNKQNIIGWILNYLIIGAASLSILSCADKPVTILYSANLNSNLESCKCEKPDVGGMLRLKTAIDSLRLQDPGLILVDSGDLFNTFTQPKQDSLQAAFLGIIKYDFMNFGDQEMVEGWPWLKEKIEQYQFPVYSANLLNKTSGELLFPDYKIFERNGKKILILGVISPQALDFIPMPEFLVGDISNSIRSILKAEKNNFDSAILIYHGSHFEAVEILDQFPEINLSICGHSQQKIAEQRNGQWLLQPGEDAEYLGKITLFSKGHSKIKHEFLPMGPFYRDDSLMRQHLEKYYRDLKKGKI